MRPKRSGSILLTSEQTPGRNATNAARLQDVLVPRKRRRRSASLALLFFTVVWIIGFADLTYDYSLVYGTEYWNREFPTSINQTLQSISVFLSGLLVILGILNLLTGRSPYHPSREVGLFLVLFVMSNIFGAVIGFSKGVSPQHIVGDARNVGLYLVIFAITITDHERRLRYLRNLFFTSCAILMSKLFFSMVYDLIVQGSLSWRYQFKLAILFNPMFFVPLFMFMNSMQVASRRKYLLLVVLAVVGICTSQTRGIFLGTFAGLLFSHIFLVHKKHLPRLIFIESMFLGISLVAVVMLRGDVSMIFGDWQSDLYRLGLEFRLQQVDMLTNMFRNNWLTGAGLGAFDPNWIGHEDGLRRPYLVELEYLNLLAKLGVMGLGLLVSAFGFLIVGCIRAARKASTLEQRGLLSGLAAGLIALMASSMTNTGYSSMYFHLYIVLILLVLSDLHILRKAARWKLGT